MIAPRGPILAGERVRLRPAEAADAHHLVRWANVPEFAWHQWGRAAGRFSDESAARDWIARFEPPAARFFLVEHEGRPVGFANYREWRPKPRSCEVGIGIGEPDLWSHGLGRDALRALVHHLEQDLGAHRISLSVLAFNDRAIAAYKACGFEVEGVERDAVLTDARPSPTTCGWATSRDGRRPLSIRGRSCSRGGTSGSSRSGWSTRPSCSTP